MAKVASNAVSGSAYVQQSGLWSTPVPFTVITAAVTSVVPAIAAPTVPVTINGSGFGASQGTRQVFLGGGMAPVQSWSDTQIVAQVPAGTTGSGAQVLQNGVMSQSAQFTVEVLHLSGVGVTPPGTDPHKFTLTGTGFGTTAGVVQLGDTAGNVVSWSDTQVVRRSGPRRRAGWPRFK